MEANNIGDMPREEDSLVTTTVIALTEEASSSQDEEEMELWREREEALEKLIRKELLHAMSNVSAIAGWPPGSKAASVSILHSNSSSRTHLYWDMCNLLAFLEEDRDRDHWYEVRVTVRDAFDMMSLAVAADNWKAAFDFAELLIAADRIAGELDESRYMGTIQDLFDEPPSIVLYELIAAIAVVNEYYWYIAEYGHYVWFTDDPIEEYGVLLVDSKEKVARAFGDRILHQLNFKRPPHKAHVKSWLTNDWMRYITKYCSGEYDSEGTTGGEELFVMLARLSKEDDC